ncbi:MAG TPA: dihydrolipoyllysine-residue acetyltransferase [Burkholderiaceae bacterium]|nr:dihydrolipoyllysine-residue acetyltransferase [Burkholderiaceae bacterium]
MSNTVEIKVPDIGDADEVDVIEVLVAENDHVEVDQSLITLESDKASMEIPSPQAGVVKSGAGKVGDKVSEGSLILHLEASEQADGDQADAGGADAPRADDSEDAGGAGQSGQVTPASAAAAGADAGTDKPAAQDEQKPASGSGAKADAKRELASTPPERLSPTASFASDAVAARNLPHASPSVRKFARELGVDLYRVEGSGARQRITHDDVRRYVKQELSREADTRLAANGAGSGLQILGWPKVDFERFGEIETQPLSRIKKLSGANLHRNWVMIPHVTNNDQADITELEELRQQLNKEHAKDNVRVTMLAFLIKASVAALKKFPEFNASLDGDSLVLKKYYHIGFAADTPGGLVVPVIRDADQKGVLELARETAELAGLAREGKLSAAQMQGGCFTISSLGGIGGTSFTPIINAPEVAILGVSRSSMQPVWNGKKFKPRLMLPLSLSYDHRVIDGAAAARFNAYLGNLLADFRRVIL